MAEIFLLQNVFIRNVFQLIIFISAVISLSSNTGDTSATDDYLAVNKKQCFASHQLLSCFKYKLSKALWAVATNRFDYFQKESSRSKSDEKFNFGFVQLSEPSAAELFENVRDYKDDNEVGRAWNFFKRTLQVFMQGHGIEFPLLSESGAKVQEISSTKNLEPRAKKKNKKGWMIVLPLIILIKIVHLKMTLVLLLLGIGGLQFLLLLGVAYVIHYLKANTLCKIHPHLVQTHSHQYSVDPEYSAIGSNYHHHPGAGSDYGVGGYNKDWGSSKAYSGYNFHETSKD